MNKLSASSLRVWRLTAPCIAKSPPLGETLFNGQSAVRCGAAAPWGEHRPAEHPGCQPLSLSCCVASPAERRLMRTLRRCFSHKEAHCRWRWLNAAIEQALEEMSFPDE